MRRDPAPVEVARYALAPPLVELPLVLGELAGIAGVVEETRGLQLLDSVVDCLRWHPLAFEARAQLDHRELTAGDRLVGQVDRPLALGPPHGSPRAQPGPKPPAPRESRPRLRPPDRPPRPRRPPQRSAAPPR